MHIRLYNCSRKGKTCVHEQTGKRYLERTLDRAVYKSAYLAEVSGHSLGVVNRSSKKNL